jgi:hypothetical protein
MCSARALIVAAMLAAFAAPAAAQGLNSEHDARRLGHSYEHDVRRDPTIRDQPGTSPTPPPPAIYDSTRSRDMRQRLGESNKRINRSPPATLGCPPPYGRDERTATERLTRCDDPALRRD